VLIGGADDEPRARFVTDPPGVREVFRLRGVPLGGCCCRPAGDNLGREQ
jgi:hypothetical protein